MESQIVLGFKEATSSEVFGEGNYKLVPWISWDDWSFVRESLFAASPESIDSALRRISAWRSRGCLPVMIEVTAAIMEIRQKDSFFRDGLPHRELLSEDMLTMLYCMTIMRLVNGVVEKTRKKNEISIAEAADVIGIPRMLIDIRHECSHRDLPSLRLVRLASTKALDWLKSYYWEPQRMAIPSDRAANLRKEMKSKIRELALSLNVKQTTPSSSPVHKRKRIKHSEHLCGRNKFLSFMAVKLQSSKHAGSKKKGNKALKNVVKLYSSSSSEVVSVLLDFLLNGRESADPVELTRNSQVGDSTRSFRATFDDWKPVIVKLSNKEPEMLLTLLITVLQMVETKEAPNCNPGEGHLKPEHNAGYCQTEQLSGLFEWLVGNLKNLKPSRRKSSATDTFGSPKDTSLPKSALMDLIRKCLTCSSLGNNHLRAAALVLAQMARNDTLVEKLSKLASLHTSKVDAIEELSPITSQVFHTQQENSICQAAKKLELFKQKLSQRSKLKPISGDTEKKNRWTVARRWKQCPIGMLPSDFGSSGILPVLDIVDDHKEHEKLAESNEKWELNQCRSKREADYAVAVLDDSDTKKLKVSENNDEEYRVLEDIKGRVMIGGVWKRVTDDELINITSAVRVLV